MKEYTRPEDPPDSLSSNTEIVTGTVRAPTVYSPTIRENAAGSYLSLFE